MNSANYANDHPAIEELWFTIPAYRLNDFFVADANTWTPFLSAQPGFGGKMQVYNESRNESTITVGTLVFWESFEAWKSVPADGMVETDAQFRTLFGSDPLPRALPTDNGWHLYENSSVSTKSPLGCILSETVGTRMCTTEKRESCSSDGFIAVVIAVAFGLLAGALAYILFLRRQIQKLSDSHALRQSLEEASLEPSR